VVESVIPVERMGNLAVKSMVTFPRLTGRPAPAVRLSESLSTHFEEVDPNEPARPPVQGRRLI
jgi:hypothetical protein